MGNPVVHFEIGCKDRETTVEFYSKLFDWTIQEKGPAMAISTGGQGIGGHITSLGHGPHQYIIFYVEVDDIDQALAKAGSLGGTKLVGPLPIPAGKFAWFLDPGGNTVGLIQPSQIQPTASN